MCVAGQIATVTSIFLKHSPAGIWMHIGGLCLLWASAITYAYGIRNDNHTHLAVLSYLTLANFTVRTLLGGHIHLLWQKIDARIGQDATNISFLKLRLSKIGKTEYL